MLGRRNAALFVGVVGLSVGRPALAQQVEWIQGGDFEPPQATWGGEPLTAGKLCVLSTYERSVHAPGARRPALGDGSLRIPERGNGVPDILDEARWELEFLLAMQVPADRPLAGMVHHKLHDNAWTALPMDPARDSALRELHRPSTAATLNLAAAAAQGARLYGRYDRADLEQPGGARHRLRHQR